MKNLPTKIGLSLSGGGFRAAAFHLGTLAYLDRVDLLPRVTALSTVSGGTFTGARYVISRMENQDFEDFFRAYYSELKANDLITKCLAQLRERPTTIISAGRPDLITAIAETHSQNWFYCHSGDRPYTFGDILNGDTLPLSEITFNATDFKSGIAFRFQKSATGGLIGNYYSQISKADASLIRLGDIVAASSCFPGGFEPLKFPGDFVWPEGKLPENIASQFDDEPIGLMDGGVYDNQGIDSLMLADSRSDKSQAKISKAARGLDMFILSDTDRRSDNLYPYPKSLKVRWNPTLQTLGRIANIVQWICLAFIVLIIAGIAVYKNDNTTVGILHYCIYGLSMLLSASVAATIYFGISFLKKTIQKSALPEIPVVGSAGWKDLRHVRLEQILNMFNLRLTSLVAMSANIFMKRIRQLGYRIIYENKHYDGKRVANFVYHITDDDGSVEKAADLETISPGLKTELDRIAPFSSGLRATIDHANNMETTLWFNDDLEQPNLVAAGQATICFNLMKYVVRNFPYSDVDKRFESDQAQELWKKLVSDWKQFNDQPTSLLN